MKRLSKPDIDPRDIYTSCVRGVSDTDLAARFNSAEAAVLELAKLYEGRASTNELYLFHPSPWGDGAALVIRDLTKENLTALYANCMVKRDQPGRRYYDSIMSTAPLGKCPFCGFGQVSTLDHFLSKARYPSFSVLPINLIPACTDCNKGKGSSLLDAQNQIPHPYFEEERIETDAWLHASVRETSPATATFFASPPDNWPADLSRRVVNYFRDLNLATRFAIEAASELASLSDILGALKTSQQIGEHLNLIASTERGYRKNTWKAALYEALSGSVWYREGGYQRPVA